MKKWLLLVIFFVCSPGCIKQNTQSFKKKYSANEPQEDVVLCDDIDFVRQQEARLVDIPIPLNATPVPQDFWMDEKDSANGMLSYTLMNVNSHDVVSFYAQEMERFGWEQTASFNAHEILLIFEKPGRVCSISLRPVNGWDNHVHNNKFALIIFYGK